MHIDWPSAALGVLIAIPLNTIVGVVIGAPVLIVLGVALYLATEVWPVRVEGRRLRIDNDRTR